MPARGFLSRRSRAQAAVDADSSGLAPNALLARLGLESVADELASTQAVGVVRMVDLARALESDLVLINLSRETANITARSSTANPQTVMSAVSASAPPLDAAELVAAVLDAFATDPGLLASEREHVRHLVVDDAQDMDPQQLELARTLGATADAWVCTTPFGSPVVPLVK